MDGGGMERTRVDNFTFRVKITKASKEEVDIGLCNGQGKSPINKTPLKYPERLSHRFIHEANVPPFWASDFKIVQARPENHATTVVRILM